MHSLVVILRTPLLLSLLFLFNFSFCQSHPNEQLPIEIKAGEKIESYFGLQNRNEWARDIIELYDKGYYISGGFEGEEFNNGWNIKIDKNLEIIYDKVLEHDLSTIAPQASISDEKGNIYLAGYTTYPDQWPFVTKIDSCGNKLWCKTLSYEDTFNYGWATDIVLTVDDEVVVLVTLINDEQPADQMNMTHLIGLSETGDVLWKKPYASRNDYPWIRQPIGNSIYEFNSEYYVSGKCYWPNPNDTTLFILRPLFIGIDSLFDEKWILPFAPLDSFIGKAYESIPLNDSIIMGVGYRMSESEIYNSILMYYDIDGNNFGHMQFTNESIGNNIDFNAIREIERINDSLFISPYYLGIEGDTYFGEFVYDTSGIVYNNTIRDIYTGNSSLLKTSENEFVIAIEVEESKGDDDIYVYKIDENLNDVPFDPTPHTYDSLCPGGIQSGTIDLTSCFVWTDVSEAPSPSEYFSFIATIPVAVFPNPANNNITFSLQNTQHHKDIELRCFNLLGEEVFATSIIPGQLEAAANVSQWPEGMYVGVVYSEGWVVGECKFVVE